MSKHMLQPITRWQGANENGTGRVAVAAGPKQAGTPGSST
tara:strand:- start:12010 stop:12129 length:120 start_codon:yes stop_codon:yes gene_type:complete